MVRQQGLCLRRDSHEKHAGTQRHIRSSQNCLFGDACTPDELTAAYILHRLFSSCFNRLSPNGPVRYPAADPWQQHVPGDLREAELFPIGFLPTHSRTLCTELTEPCFV